MNKIPDIKVPEKCKFCRRHDAIMKTSAGTPICADCANTATALVGLNKKAEKVGNTFLRVLDSKPK